MLAAKILKWIFTVFFSPSRLRDIISPPPTQIVRFQTYNSQIRHHIQNQTCPTWQLSTPWIPWAEIEACVHDAQIFHTEQAQKQNVSLKGTQPEMNATLLEELCGQWLNSTVLRGTSTVEVDQATVKVWQETFYLHGLDMFLENVDLDDDENDAAVSGVDAKTAGVGACPADQAGYELLKEYEDRLAASILGVQNWSMAPMQIRNGVWIAEIVNPAVWN